MPCAVGFERRGNGLLRQAKSLLRHRSLSPWFPRLCATVAHKRRNHPDERGGGKRFVPALNPVERINPQHQLLHSEFIQPITLGSGQFQGRDLLLGQVLERVAGRAESR